MAHELDKIINLLREMQRSNNANADSFDRLLTELSEKFDTTNNGASTELISAYISELTKSVDDKYSVTLSKFQDIEQALKAVYNNQSDSVKNSDMKELFDVFSKNVNNFYTEARQEKAILSGIESKLADLISNKSDKHDIIRTVSLLKNDFENINHAYKSTIDNVNTNLKSILSNLINMDPTKSGDTAKAQIEIMYHSVNDIVNKLQYFEEKSSALEKILNNVATNKDLKITKGIIDSIIAKTYEIEQILKQVADKDDVDEIRQALEYLNKRADRMVTVDEFIEIRKKTDDLLTQTDEVKQSLGKVAQDIEGVPVGEELEESMRKLYGQVDDLAQTIEASSVKDDMDLLTEKLETLKDELELIKNIINDLNDAISTRVISAVETVSFESDAQYLKDSISNMLEALPQKEDIDNILQNNTNIFQNLLEKTEDISNKLDSIPTIEENIESIAQEQKNLSQQISDIDFEKEFSYIYDKTTSIESWLIDSNIKENSERIAAQIQSSSSLADLEQVNFRTNQIIEYLEELTKSKDVDDAGENIAQIDANVLEIISLLKNSSVHDDNVEISDKLSDLERSISEIVSRNEFNDFIEELKYCITKLTTNTGSCSQNIEQMLELRKEIEEKLNSFDFSQVLRVLNGKFDKLQERLSDSITEEVMENIQAGVAQALATNETFEEVKGSVASVTQKIETAEQNIASIDEFIRNNLPLNEEFVKNQIDEIRNLVSGKSGSVSASFDADDLDIIKDYLDDIRSIVSQDPNDELMYKISAIEDMISVNHTFNETAFSNIIDKLDSLKADIDSVPETTEQLNQSLSEISSLTDALSSLTGIKIPKSKKSVKDDKSEELEKFLEEKFEDLKQSLAGMTSGKEGFAYQSVLSEEKAEALTDFISEMKSKSEEGYAEKFDEINEKLSDFKQELQLVSTDITECLNAKMTDILSKIASVKAEAQGLEIGDNSDEIVKNVDKLYQDAVKNELSPQNSLLIENLHDKLTEKLQKSQEELKDFLLNDTDSIIIKLDSLRDYIESSISGFSSPDAEGMPEMKDFRAGLNDFQASFEKSLKDTADSIMSYISLQNDDIKSLLTVAKNHDDIIEAIEGLKSYIRKIKNVDVSDDTQDGETDNSGLSSAEYEDICAQFKKFSQKIEELSDQNTSITSVLDSIGMKLDETFAPKDIEDDFDTAEVNDFISEEKSDFDFVKAFELLQNDISSLKNTVKGLAKIKVQKGDDAQSLDEDNAAEISDNSPEDVLESLNENWLDDIKDYISASNGDISAKLDEISSKLDIVVSDNSNTELLEDISDTVYNVDEKISSMLEALNKRIGEIPSGGNASDEIADIKNLIEEQQTYIEQLQPSEKLEAFKKCLDELTKEVSNLASDTDAGNQNLHKTVKDMKDSLMNAVITIFDQVSFVEESEDIKDFVEERTDEINKNIEQITKQLQQISSGVPNDYNYSLQDIETDLAKLRLALNELKEDQSDVRTDDMAQITDKLHSISSLVDSLTQEEMQTLKSDISALKEQTQFLIATSDKSYNALNSGIVGFEEIINDNLTGKVDKVTKMLEKSADSDNVIKQALIYMGEWIDSASENINKISANSDEITKIKDSLDSLKASINTEVTQSIENKFDLWNANLQKLERQFAKVENMEEQFSRQQDRIDRLEMNIDKLVSMVENIDDSASIRKIEKIEKQLSKLGTSIEKLTSYVE